MSASRKDRKQIESLHEMSLSDSNGHFVASSSKWDGPPVTIVPPSNESRQARIPSYELHMPSANLRNQDSYNPYGAGRLRSTLASAAALGKRTSTSDSRGPRPISPPACARKKVRVDKKNKLPQGREVIDLELERTDTSSPDPLNHFDHTNGSIVDNESSSSGAVASTSRLPPDGLATKTLKHALQDTRPSSPIEDFEDDIPKNLVGREPRKGRVKHFVFKIENKKIEDMYKAPVIDLKSKLTQPNPLDPVATSSGFLHNGYSIKPNKDYNLPVKAYAIDHRLISQDSTTEPVLTWNANGSNLTISCKPDKTVVALDTKSIDNIEYARSSISSPDFEGMPVLAIHMEKPIPRLPRGSGSVHFRPSLVTIMLDSSTGKWSTGFCDSFLNWLKSQKVQTRICRNGKQMWEAGVTESNAPDQDQDFWNALGDKERAVSCPSSRPSDVRPTPEAKSNSNELDEPGTGKSDTASDRPFQLRRSSRNVTVTIKKPKPPVDPDEVILVYPQGQPGAINITNADVGRLHPGEFLNDTVIEFGLKLWHKELESSNPEFAKDVHVFSSFFYKKLNKRNFEEGYQSVRKWTSKINLFDKKYIIIPINEHLHWYLAIIYMPEYILQPPVTPIKPTPASRTRSRTSKTTNDVERPKSPANDILSAATTSISKAEDQLENDLDEIQKSCTVTVTEDHSTVDVMDIVPSHPGNDDHSFQPIDESAMDVDKSEEDAVQEQLRADSIFSDEVPSDMEVEAGIPSEHVSSRFFPDHSMKPVIELDSQGQQTSVETSLMLEQHHEGIHEEEYDDQTPENDEGQGDELGLFPRTYIFTLDSLGTRHIQATRQLSRYLKMEASHKQNVSNTSDAISKAVPVPTQPNFCDCGIYLLHFARTFMTDPVKYFQTIIASKKPPPASDRKAIWQDYKVGTMRQELVERIKELSEEWKKTRQDAKKDQAETVSGSDSEIEYVETAPASVQAKMKTPKSDGKRYKTGKSSRLRG